MVQISHIQGALANGFAENQLQSILNNDAVWVNIPSIWNGLLLVVQGRDNMFLPGKAAWIRTPWEAQDRKSVV